MCAICMTSPCVPRCPNAPEPVAVDDCHLCDSPIREGEVYFTISDVAVCCNCLKSMTILQLEELVDMTVADILIELGGKEKVGEVD